MGARSASDASNKAHKRAQYHLYGIERREVSEGEHASRFKITLRIRGWDVSSKSFRAEEERVLL